MSEPLRVVHSRRLWLPMTENWLYTQVAHLPAEIEPHVVCARTTNLEHFQVEHLHVAEDEPAWLRQWDRLRRRLRGKTYQELLVRQAKRCGAKLIHSHFGTTGWSNLGAAKRAGCRHVVTFYGYDIRRIPQSKPEYFDRYKKMFAQVDAVLCEGPHMGESLLALGARPEQIVVQRLGIELEGIECMPRQLIPGEPLRVLMASRFQEKKGLPYGIEALAELQHEHPVEVTLIGDASGDSASDASEKRRILDAAEQGGLRLNLLGYQPRARLFEEAFRHHLFLAPSVTAEDGDCEGGAPVSLIEMSATGMPIVSTRHCDIPGVVLDGQSGWLAEERDPRGLLDKLRWMLHHPDRWEAMGRAGRRHIEHDFDARRQGERLAELYGDVVDGGLSRSA